MTRWRLAALVIGATFGFLISWGQFTDPDRIRQMLLLEDPYLYLMMFTSIAATFRPCPEPKPALGVDRPLG